jgi:kumamolisin
MPDARNYRAITGSERHARPEFQIAGNIDPKEVLTITVRLRRLSPKGELHAEAMDLSRRPPRSRNYLKRHEFEAKHGASEHDIEKVISFAHEYGLTVVEASRAKRQIKLSGTVEALCAAFRVELRRYAKGKASYRGRVGSIFVPDELAEIIVGVHGLDNRPVAKPHNRLRQLQIPPLADSPRNAQDGSFSVPDLAQLYNFPPGLDGTRQCIALIELNDIDPTTNKVTGTGFNPSDLQSYFTSLNLPTPQVISLSTDGGTNLAGSDPNADGEVTLDIEVAGAIAPAAKIAVYFAPNTSQGFVDALAQAIHDGENSPSVVSISWGGPEDFQPQQLLDGLDQSLQDAATLGVTVCCAAGDNGSADMPANDPNNPWDGAPHVDFPASSPFALACGGTSLQGSGSTISSERVWNDGVQGGAGGGGVSNRFQRPAYQNAFNIPASPKGNNGRGVPDVSGDADPATGYQIFLAGKPGVVGGTSAVAPLWAGLVARVNQRLAAIGSKPAGFFNPLIYNSSVISEGAFHDIVVGNNDITGTLNGLYPAGQGWDAATGLGSPNGTKLLQVLGG